MPQNHIDRMQRVTPTQLAEEAYAARPRRSYPVGPAGIPLPPAGALYRPQVDPDLLKRIAAAAVDAHEAQQLPPTGRAAVAQAIADAINASHPPADMEVLARYGAASRRDAVMVAMERPFDYQPAEWVTLPAPLMLPTGVARMRLPQTNATDAIVPHETIDWFERVLAVRHMRRRLKDSGGWVRHFHNREQRQPRWAEIEAEFAPIGAWLAQQREAARG